MMKSVFACDKLARRANHSDFQKSCQAPESKIFLFFGNPNQRMVCPSHPTRGTIAIVTNVRWDAVDAKAATDERGLSRTAKACGPGAPMLAPSFAGFSREVTVAKELASPGRA